MASKARVSAVLKGWCPVDDDLYTRFPNSYTSPPFASEAKPDVRWKLTVGNGNSAGSHCDHGSSADQCEECSQCLEFSLELEGGGDPKELVPQLHVSVTADDIFGEEFFQGSPTSHLPFKRKLRGGRAWVINPRISVTVSFVPPEEEPAELGTLASTWCRRLLADPKYADFEIRVGEDVVPIHRAIFAAASEVFARMFQRDMDEKAQGFVVVEDASAKAMAGLRAARMFQRDMDEKAQGFVVVKDFSAKAMAGLRAFLYTGQLTEVRADPATYLDLGEKYGIQELKDACHSELRRRLSFANLCERAVLADKYRLEGLFEDCRRLVKGTDQHLTVPNEDWDKLTKDHPIVALNLINPRYHH